MPGRAVCRPHDPLANLRATERLVFINVFSVGFYTVFRLICYMPLVKVFFFAPAVFWSVVVFGFASSPSCCGVAFAARSRSSVYGRVSYYSHALSKKNHDSADHVYFAVYIFKELLPLAGSRARCSGCQQA